MKSKTLLCSFLVFFCSFSTLLFAQKSSSTTTIKGKITLENESVGFATIQIKEKISSNNENKIIGTTTDKNGNYELKQIPFGTFTLLASYLGFEMQTKTVVLNEENPVLEVNFDLK